MTEQTNTFDRDAYAEAIETVNRAICAMRDARQAVELLRDAGEQFDIGPFSTIATNYGLVASDPVFQQLENGAADAENYYPVSHRAAEVNRIADKFGIDLPGRKAEVVELPSEADDAATVVVGSDRYPATIVEGEVGDRRIVIQEDAAFRTDDRGFSESQDYRYEPNPDAPREVWTLRKNGRYYRQGQPMGRGALTVGRRRKYSDPHF